MRKIGIVTLAFAALTALLLLGVYHASVQAQGKAAGRIIPVNIDRYLQGADPEVAISVSAQESVLWYSDQSEFKVIDLRPISADAMAPRHGFYRRFPSQNDVFSTSVSSGIARPAAAGHTYKATFQLQDGRVIDPHIQIGP